MESSKGVGLPNGLLLSFYGDDFTGSTDGMEALARAGLRTVLFLSPPTPEQLARWEGVQAIGVAGVSRSLTPAEMDAELPSLFSQLRALSAPLFHVKVCSTFDSSPQIGSIGHTIDIGQSIFGSPFVPLVVGAPLLNRFCVFGNLFARSGPESEVFRLDRHPTMSQHPITPMDESDLRLHLAKQTSKTIGLVDVQHLAGVAASLTTLVDSHQAANHEIVLFDTLTDAHLASIGRVLWSYANPSQPLFTIGSSGIEYALTAYWREQGWLPEPPTFFAPPVDRIAVVSGSCSPVTARQIEWAVANGFVDIPLPPACWLDTTEAENAVQSSVQSARVALHQGHSVIVHTCQGPQDPRRTATLQRLATSAEPQRNERQLGVLLGQILAAILRQTPLRRAVVCGGDTSSYVARELGLEALEMVRPMAPGSPLCRVFASESPLNGLEMLFKGGQVGKIDLFGSILRGTME